VDEIRIGYFLEDIGQERFLRYKQALRDAIRQTGIIAPLGGLEYGPDIAEVLGLYGVGKADAGFKHFLDELQAGLVLLARGQEEWPSKSS
jgi:hypothetical protein